MGGVQRARRAPTCVLSPYAARLGLEASRLRMNRRTSSWVTASIISTYCRPLILQQCGYGTVQQVAAVAGCGTDG